jgi:hypothetical protein
VEETKKNEETTVSANAEELTADQMNSVAGGKGKADAVTTPTETVSLPYTKLEVKY